MAVVADTEPRGAGLKEIILMTGPVVLGSLSSTVMQFVDTAMVGHYSTEAMAAVGASGICSHTCAVFIIGIVTVVSTFVSQNVGRGTPEQSVNYTWQALYMSLLFGLASFILWPAALLFNYLGHDPELVPMEISYFRIRLFGYGFIFWLTTLTSFFQGIGRPAIPMYAAFLGNIVNIILDYLLIFGIGPFPEWGVKGAAIATVIGLAVQAILLHLLFILPAVQRVYATLHAHRFNRGRSWEIVRIGFPSGLAFFMDMAVWMIFTLVIIGRFGTIPLAAHTAALSCMMVSFMVAVGINHGVAPVVGKWIGAGNIVRAKARAYTALRLGMAYMIVVGIVFAVFGPNIIRTFFPNDDPAYMRIAHILLILAAIFQAFDAINIILLGALRGAGDTRWTAILLVVGGYCFLLPISWLFGFVFEGGAVGAWIGVTIYVIGLSGIIFRRFHSERWREISIFSEEPPD